MEVTLNGNKLCTAGIGDGVLSTIVDVNGKKEGYYMMFRVGGLENNEFLTWATRDLLIGDEIGIRIVETESIDAPIERRPND